MNPVGVETDYANLSVVEASGYAKRVLATKPVVYWNFDENDGATVAAQEVISSEVSKRLTATVAQRTIHSGFGNAAVVNGTAESVFHNTALGAGFLGGPYAIEFMIHTDDLNQNEKYILSFGAGGNDPAIIFNFAPAWSPGNAITKTENIDITNNEAWQHFVIVQYFNGSNIDIYQNGVLRPEIGFQDYQYDPAVNLENGVAVGAVEDNISGLPQYIFTGGIDEIAFYDLSEVTSIGAIETAGQIIASHSHATGLTSIVQSPEGVVIDGGGTATFRVVASGAEPLTYQWKKDGIPIPNSNYSVLLISSATRGDQGLYTCTVSNPESSETTFSAMLTVEMYCPDWSPYDFNDDCIIDLVDFAEFAAHWLDEDLVDFAEFAAHWLDEKGI
ncbi:MAG: hypothetical protein A2Y12_15130 [Planctomycetes bacterium GWF2_42_9]|nr:MAG: hypothetical protein A2Y12_15130 [Planctomycetes bacterium GWF2_42_9]